MVSKYLRIDKYINFQANTNNYLLSYSYNFQSTYRKITGLSNTPFQTSKYAYEVATSLRHLFYYTSLVVVFMWCHLVGVVYKQNYLC